MIFPDITNAPLWFYVIALLFSVYYGWRGYKGTLASVKAKKDENSGSESTSKSKNMFNNLSERELIWVYCVQQFISHFLCSISGFLALYILSQCKEIKNTEGSIFIIFLSLYSIAGITDILPELLPQGKFPGR